MPDTDVIRKNLAQQLQECGDVCRTVWEQMLDSADPGSLGASRFNPQELKNLSENTNRAQESLQVCQQLLNRRVSPVGTLRMTLDSITNSQPQDLVETDPQQAAQHLASIERGIAALQNVRAAQQKVG